MGKPYRLNVINSPKPASEVGTDFVPTFYLPVTAETAPFIRGMLRYLAYEEFWTGTESEIAQAIQVIERQIAEPLLTQADICGTTPAWGMQLRTVGDILQTRQGFGFPEPPFITRVDIRGEGENQEYWLQYDSEVNPMGWVDAGLLPRGADGRDGIDGINGTNGIDGINGTNGIDGRDGIDGMDGESRYIETGFRYLNEGFTDIIIGTGRFRVLNPDTGNYDYDGEQFDIGVPLVAPRGADGDDGTDGEGVTIVYQEAVGLPAPSQGSVWLYVAQEIAKTYAEIGVNEGQEGAVQLVLNVLYRVGTAYLPVETLYETLGLMTPAIRAALQSTTALQVASELLYCQFIQNPQLTNVQLDLISDNLGSVESWDNNPAFIGEILASYVMQVAKSEGNKFRNTVSTIRAIASTVETLPDASGLPCTPPPENEWQHVFDFLIDDRGWQAGIIGIPNAQAIYVPGEGWNETSASAQFGIHYDFGVTTTITEFELLIQNPGFTDYIIGRGGVTGEAPQTLTFYFPEEQTTYLPITWSGNRIVSGVFVSYVPTFEQERVIRVSIAGRGVNPFE